MKELLLIPALLIALAVSFLDVKTQRIPNIAVLALLLFGLVFQFLSLPNLFVVAPVLLYVLLVSFLIWWLGIWPAGDAKFFFVLFFFLSPFLLSKFSIVTTVFINVFVPISFFMVFVVFARSKFDLLKKAIGYAFVPYNIFMIFVIITGFLWFAMKPVSMLGLPHDYFISIILLFFFFEFFKAFLSFRLELFMIAAAIVRIIIDFRTVYSVQFFVNFALLAFLFIFFRFFVLYLSFHLYTKKVSLSKLKPGMSPAEFIVPKNNGFEKRSFLQSSFVGYLGFAKEKPLHGLDFLSAEEIKEIQLLRKQKKIPFSNIRIGERQPFAPFILLGVILTILFSGDLFSLIRLFV